MNWPPSPDHSVAAYGHVVARGVARLLAGRFVALTLSFLAITILARALGPGSTGTLQFWLAIFFYVGFMNDLGLTTTGVRDLARGDRPSRVIGEVVGARLGLTGAAVLVLGLGFMLVPLEEEERLIGMVLSTGLIASSLNLSWVLQGREQFNMLAGVEVIAALAQLLGVTLLVTGRNDVVLGAVAVVGSSWISVVLSWIPVMRDMALVPRFSLRMPAIVLRAMPLGVAAIAIAVYYTIDTVLLGIMRTNAEVGYYAVAYRLVMPILTVAVVTGNIALPVMSRLLSTDPARMPELLTGLSRALMLLALPVASGTTVIAVPLITVVFGAAYEPGALPLAILIWSCVTVFANAPFGILMIARGQDREYMRATLLGALVNVVANLLLIPAFGMIGAAVATIVAEAVVLALIVWTTRDLSLSPFFSGVAAALVPTAVMAVVIQPWRDSIIAIPIGIVAYVVVAFLTGAVPYRTLRTLFSHTRQWVTTPAPPSR